MPGRCDAQQYPFARSQPGVTGGATGWIQQLVKCCWLLIRGINHHINRIIWRVTVAGRGPIFFLARGSTANGQLLAGHWFQTVPCLYYPRSRQSLGICDWSMLYKGVQSNRFPWRNPWCTAASQHAPRMQKMNPTLANLFSPCFRLAICTTGAVFTPSSSPSETDSIDGTILFQGLCFDTTLTRRDVYIGVFQNS